jgi:hypothetical protein
MFGALPGRARSVVQQLFGLKFVNRLCTRASPGAAWMAMTTNMIDSIHATCHNIPTGTRKVAGYATGTADIRWRRADWDRFNRRHTGLVRIDQSFGGRDPLGSDVLDVETGAATPGQVAHWVRTRHAAGNRLSDGNTNRSTFPAIASALNAAGPQHTIHPHDRLWLADWSLSRAQAARLLGTRLAGHKIVAVQWASPSSNPDTPLPRSSLTLRQANCDLSVTLDYWHRHRR